MNAEIVRADQIKAGEQYAILTTGRAPLCSLHDVVPLWTRGAENEPGWIPGQLVAKILPEPVEVRDEWYFEGYRLASLKTEKEAREIAAKSTGLKGAIMVHKRTSIMSREEVKP